MNTTLPVRVIDHHVWCYCLLMLYCMPLCACARSPTAPSLNTVNITSYDALVLAPGVVSDASSIPGLGDHIDFCSKDDVLRSKSALDDLIARAKGGATIKFIVSVARMPYKCPIAPFEVAFMIDDTLRKAGVRDKAEITLTAPVAWPLPPPAKPLFTEAMAAKGIAFLGEHGEEHALPAHAQFQDRPLAQT